MDSIYRLEMKKRRSKLTKEDLIRRQETLMNLQSEIQEIKEMQRFNITCYYNCCSSTVTTTTTD